MKNARICFSIYQHDANLCLLQIRLISQRRLRWKLICKRIGQIDVFLFGCDITDYNLFYKEKEFLKFLVNNLIFHKMQQQRYFSSFLHNFCLNILQTIVISQIFGNRYWLCLQQLLIPNRKETWKLSKCIFEASKIVNVIAIYNFNASSNNFATK